MQLTLNPKSAWERELEKRILRGVALLDAVTPDWFTKINPATLEVSNRGMCVFAQAAHSFAKGIVDVARSAIEKGIEVKLLDNPITEKCAPGMGRGRDWWTGEIKFDWLPPTSSGRKVLDVFYYGFDVTWQDATHYKVAIDAWDKRGSRVEAFKSIDRMWHDVVVQKQQAVSQPAKPASRKRCPEGVKPPKSATTRRVAKRSRPEPWR